jgi:hypothetical protein
LPGRGISPTALVATEVALIGGLAIAVLLPGCGLAPPPAVEVLPPAAEGLPEGGLARLGSDAFRHPGVADVAWSVDGRIATCGHGDLEVWDATTGALVLERLDLPGEPTHVAISGERFAVGGQGILLLDASGQSVAEIATRSEIEDLA